MKIAVALSGGVDSTTVARQLLDAGHEVIGLTMQLCPDLSQMPAAQTHELPAASGTNTFGCAWCAAHCACPDGAAAARSLGIEHEVVDFREAFERLVIRPFMEYYARGLTPNPCAFCNRAVKFGILLDHVLARGADALATGHYADLTRDGRTVVLQRAHDRSKDQTYFMALVPQERFRNVLFPLSGQTKQDVSAQAQSAGLADDKTVTSNEICFLRDCSYTDFLRHRAPELFVPGPIVDASGKNLGTHQGLPCYTVGQRRGMGIAAKQPLYVVALRPEENTLVVGEDKELLQTSVALEAFQWYGEPLSAPVEVDAMIRYRQVPRRARLSILPDREAVLEFEEPVRAVTPGQVAAVYQQDRLLGGGIIHTCAGGAA